MKRHVAILLVGLSWYEAGQARDGWNEPRVVSLADGGTASFLDVDGKVYLISCAHRDAHTSVVVGDRVGFVCNDGSGGTATVIAVAPHDPQSEPLRDCAIYSFAGQIGANVHPFKICERLLARGEPVWVCGFPAPCQQFVCRRTTVEADNGTLWLAGSSTPGESGGPIVTRDGELIGTLTGSTSEGRTICCGRATVVGLCREVQGVQVANGCHNGWCQQGFCPVPTAPQRPIRREEPRVTAGPPGPQGPPGPAGPAGPAGKDASCERSSKWEEFNVRLAALEATMKDKSASVDNVIAVVATNSNAVEALRKQLDRDTPVRVFLPDGKVAGETRINLFRGDALDFTFNPRVLVDETRPVR